MGMVIRDGRNGTFGRGLTDLQIILVWGHYQNCSCD